MTPMEMIKDQLKEFKELIGERFDVLDLNGASPRTTYGNEMSYGAMSNTAYVKKGVANDFVRKYSIKFNKEHHYSMAFSFNYLNTPEEDWSINYSLKVMDGEALNIIYSSIYAVKEFREKLKEVNKKLQEEEFEYDEIIQIVSENFIDNFNVKLNYVKKTDVNKKRQRKIKLV